MSDDQKLKELIEDAAQATLKELGIQDDTPEAQAEVLRLVGKNIFDRVMLEMLKVLPPHTYEMFEKFIRSGDIDGLRAFLEPYIPDLDAFIRREAEKEYQTTKARAKELSGGL